MSHPYSGERNNRGKSRDRTPVMSSEDSLMVEAYGPRGAAARKTAAKIGEGVQAGETKTKSSIASTIESVVGAVKRVTGRAKTDRKS